MWFGVISEFIPKGMNRHLSSKDYRQSRSVNLIQRTTYRKTQTCGV